MKIRHLGISNIELASAVSSKDKLKRFDFQIMAVMHMLSERMLKGLNEQVTKELFSAYFYLGIAAYFKDSGFEGFSTWMEAQAEEELGHAIRIYDYVFERGGKVELYKIEMPKQEFESPLKAFEAVYLHEVGVTESIYKLVEIAQEENDHATYQFLQWFVEEQVEEEATAKAVVDKLKIIGDHPQGLFMLDRELGTRVPRLRGLLIQTKE